VEKIHAYKNNCMDLTDSIVEKMMVMMRTATEIEEKAGLKRYFGTFLSFLV
jgi:hypothetical protein